MAQAMNRATLASMLVPGLDQIVSQNYNAVKEEHNDLFETRSSSRNYEEQLMVGNFGRAAEKLEGDTIRFDSLEELYKQRWLHQTIALGYTITEEAIEDNIYAERSALFATALGRAMGETKQMRAANYFNLAFSTANGPDGKALFANDHPTTDAGNFDNTLTGQLSETALENAIIKIQRQTDDRGNLTGATAQKLVIPTSLMFTARKILDSDLSTSVTTQGSDGVTNVNDKNIVGSGGFFPGGVKTNCRLSDDGAWFIQTSIPNSTLMYSRVALQTSDDDDGDRGIMKYRARERYSFGHLDFRGWYGSTGS
jgi:hypothetical protein